uniref:sphingomyelin phosphodiesterase n=1 Tax=Gouania willdenowi TaxID=441366 RepID=A0A8C5N8H4_GOUWI
MDPTDSDIVRVFSLNCWGIRYMSKHCQQRYVMIGEMLSIEKHDIVLLQEVWSEKDFLFLKNKLSYTHPHSHYFKSGVIGSGLAVFTKYRIHDTFLYRYSLNGYPYMAHHGDWFGGKAVGMVILTIGGRTAHVYVTHLHAEYCREKDSYLPHRVVQAWELQQFIRHTSAGADLVIVGGDLNMHPQDLGNRLLRSYTALKDSYLETTLYAGCEDGVTLIANNPFINKKELGPFKTGIRIDYILFKGSSKIDIHCDAMSVTKGSVPNHPFPYSDHEALTSTLRLKSHQPDESGGTKKLSIRISPKVSFANFSVIALYSQHVPGVMGLALLLLQLAIAAVPWLALGAEQPFPKTSFYLLALLCFAILLTTSLLYVFYTIELKCLQGAEDQMRLCVGHRRRGSGGFLWLSLTMSCSALYPEV